MSSKANIRQDGNKCISICESSAFNSWLASRQTGSRRRLRRVSISVVRIGIQKCGTFIFGYLFSLWLGLGYNCNLVRLEPLNCGSISDRQGLWFSQSLNLNYFGILIKWAEITFAGFQNISAWKLNQDFIRQWRYTLMQSGNPLKLLSVLEVISWGYSCSRRWRPQTRGWNRIKLAS